MVVWLAGLAVVFVLFYFWNQSGRNDDVWSEYRQRHRERRQMGPTETEINPDFQFDQNPSPAEKDNPADPH